MPSVLALTAGVFLYVYVALADLVPPLHRREHPASLASQLLLLTIGALVIVAVSHLGH